MSVQVNITLIYGDEESDADIKTNGVPRSMIIESLNTIVKGLCQQMVRESGKIVGPEDMEEFLDAQLEIDREVLKSMIRK